MICATERTNDSDLKVLCFTGRRTGPSDQYRIRQLLPHLRGHGIYLEEECLHEQTPLRDKLSTRGIRASYVAPLSAIGLAWNIRKRLRSLCKQRRFDLVWIQRNMLPGAEWLIKLVRKPVILDIDDAVWSDGAFATSRYRFLARQVNEIIVGNQWVHNWFSRYNQHVSTIPTSVDVARYIQSSNRNAGTFRIGWLGTWGNQKYVEQIAKPLKTFLESERGVELVIISDKLTTGLKRNIPEQKLRFVPWRENIEFRIADEFDVGIMPLADDEWTRGKCAFKLLQYLAAGIPAIASPVGLSSEVLQSSGGGIAAQDADQWYSAFSALRSSEALRMFYGGKGRTFIEQNYSTQRIAVKVANVMRSVVLRGGRSNS